MFDFFNFNGILHCVEDFEHFVTKPPTTEGYVAIGFSWDMIFSPKPTQPTRYYNVGTVKSWNSGHPEQMTNPG